MSNYQNKGKDIAAEKKSCWKSFEFWTWIVVIVILLVMLSACFCVFISTPKCPTLRHKDCDARWIELRDSLYFESPLQDSVSTVDKQDFERMLNAQTEIIKRQDALADDLRQETNNLINKFNGWIGFWLGIIAILGVIIPIALQFKLSKESKDEIQNLNDFQAKTEDSISKLIDNKVDELENIKYTILVRNFTTLTECTALKVLTDRNEILEQSLTKIKAKFKLLMNDWFKDSKKSRNRNEIRNVSYDISMVLVQTASVLTILKSIAPKRVRRLDYLISETYLLIDFVNTPGLNCRNLEKRLQNYYHEFSSINATVLRF